MINKILTIPKYRLPFDNGVTPIEDNVLIKYNQYMLYRPINENFKMFYRIVPYLILTDSDRYLVYNSDGHYCFNPKGLFYVKEGIIYDPVKSIVKTYIRKNNIKTKSVKCYGLIKSILKKPNDIAILYVANIEDINIENAEWMTLDDLIDKCRKFDAFGIEYINHLVIQKIKRR